MCPQIIPAQPHFLDSGNFQCWMSPAEADLRTKPVPSLIQRFPFFCSWATSYQVWNCWPETTRILGEVLLLQPWVLPSLNLPTSRASSPEPSPLRHDIWLLAWPGQSCVLQTTLIHGIGIQSDGKCRRCNLLCTSSSLSYRPRTHPANRPLRPCTNHLSILINGIVSEFQRSHRAL